MTPRARFLLVWLCLVLASLLVWTVAALAVRTLTPDAQRALCLLVGVLIGGGAMWVHAARRITDMDARLRTVNRLRDRR